VLDVLPADGVALGLVFVIGIVAAAACQVNHERMGRWLSPASVSIIFGVLDWGSPRLVRWRWSTVFGFYARPGGRLADQFRLRLRRYRRGRQGDRPDGDLLDLADRV